MKRLFFTLVVGLITSLFSPKFAEAACPLWCDCYISYDCAYRTWDGGLNSFERLGIIGSVQSLSTGRPHTQNCPSCEDGDGKCKGDAFLPGYNGQSCIARDRCYSWFTCNDFSKTGVWDASAIKCVTCDGYKENRVLGNAANVYAGCGSENGNLGDGRCESACGAAVACDDKNPGDSCGTGLICGDTCQCITAPTAGSGLNTCEYKVESRPWWGGTSWGTWVSTLGWTSAGTCSGSRLITLWQTITVGPSGLCRDQGPATCRIWVRSKDSNEYWSDTDGLTDGIERRIYNIDWTKPAAQ